MKEYTLKRGDTLNAIAARERIPVERIWGHPRNQELRRKRQRPELLYPGDVVFVPDVERKEVRGRTGAVHDLVVNLPRTPLRLRLLVDGEPCQGATCTAQAEGQSPLTTDADGKLELDLPAHLVLFKLKVDLPARPPREGAKQEPPRTRLLTFRVGHLENEIALLQARLTNLGFHCDPIDGKFGPRARRALLRFQKAFRLELTGKPDDRKALDELARLHEQEGSWSQRLTDEDKLCRSLDPPHHVLTGRWNRISLLEGPEVVIDAHMHVNSGKCCPQPLTWDKSLPLYYLRPSRDAIDDVVVPALGGGMRITRGLRASSRAAADHLAQLASDGVERARTDLSALTTTVAQALVVTGYVETEAAKRNVRAAADGAAGLLDAAGEDLRRDVATLKGASTALSAVERKLRAMVPDQASPSVEVARQASTISGRIVEAVARAYRKTKEAGAEAARQVADGVTEAAADAASVASGISRGLSDLDAELAAISRAAAASMEPLALRVNRSLDLVAADARDLVHYAAREVQAAIDQGAAQASRGVDGAARAADAKVQSALTAGEAQLKQLRDFVSIAGMETVAIADKAVQANLGTVQSIPPSTRGDRMSMMMVMPMDMDYGHLEGYDGKQIYQKVATRKVQETVLRPIKIPRAPSKVMQRRPLPPGWKFGPSTVPGVSVGPALEVRVVEEKGPFYYYHQVRHDIPIRELVWLPKEEFDLFQGYEDQVDHTLAAAAAHPWALLPLYHYDPRRWSKPSGSPRSTEVFAGKAREVYPQAWDEPFKRYFQQGGGRPFVGIKLYTALGYRPWDPRLKRQADFYDKCISLELPIVCHCSPAGMYSFDRPFFAADDAKRRGVPVDEVRRETELLMKRRGVEADWEEYWFSEHYVSPRAWREVLGQPRYGKLRLCLAHFGGDDAAFTTWKQKDQGAAGAGGGRKTIENWDTELVQLAREFENVYIDISYFVFDDEQVGRFRKVLLDNPHLRDKILFGTDWWMTEKDGIDYKRFVDQTRRALDSIDPELWPRFSWINPVRFYRLKEQAQAIASALRASAPKDRDRALAHRSMVDRGISVLQSLEPGGMNDK